MSPSGASYYHSLLNFNFKYTVYINTDVFLWGRAPDVTFHIYKN